MRLTRSVAGVAAPLALCFTVLTGCGGSGSDDDSPSDSSSQSPGGGAPSMDTSQLAAIQECLDAAGIDSQLPTDRPTDLPSDLPTDLPSDMPTDLPSDMPSDMPTDMAGGGAMMNDPEVQAALEACGIDLPQAPGGQQ